jgi:hypothetical protein
MATPLLRRGAGRQGKAALRFTQHWTLLLVVLTSALHVGCFRQQPLQWSSEPRERSALLELDPGDDVVVTFAKATRPDVTLRFERLEWPFLVGSVIRRGNEPGERHLEPTRIDLNEVTQLEHVRLDTGWTATVVLGAVASFAFAVFIGVSQMSWGR